MSGPRPLQILSHLILKMSFRGRHAYLSHFTDESWHRVVKELALGQRKLVESGFETKQSSSESILCCPIWLPGITWGYLILHKLKLNENQIQPPNVLAVYVHSGTTYSSGQQYWAMPGGTLPHSTKPLSGRDVTLRWCPTAASPPGCGSRPCTPTSTLSLSAAEQNTKGLSSWFLAPFFKQRM